MSLYGSSDKYLNEALDMFLDEESYFKSRPGLKTITEARKNADSVQLYVSEDGDKCLLSTSDLENYMYRAHKSDVEEAVIEIAESNGVDHSDIILVYDECSDYILEDIEESSLVLEKSVEDDAVNVKKIEKWYKKLVKRCKDQDKDITKKEIKDRIKLLEECVEKMTKQAADRTKDNGIIKYTLKAFIPFNNIWRFFTKHDKAAGWSFLADIFTLGSAKLYLRPILYGKMLNDNIKDTKEAIEYLKKKLEEMEKEGE